MLHLEDRESGGMKYSYVAYLRILRINHYAARGILVLVLHLLAVFYARICSERRERCVRPPRHQAASPVVLVLRSFVMPYSSMSSIARGASGAARPALPPASAYMPYCVVL
jgi:hypothetical protein